jgi:hypothetical protein
MSYFLIAGALIKRSVTNPHDKSKKIQKSNTLKSIIEEKVQRHKIMDALSDEINNSTVVCGFIV